MEKEGFRIIEGGSSTEKQEDLALKYGKAIKDFLKEGFEIKDIIEKQEFFDGVDFSSPGSLAEIQLGKFSVERIRTSPKPENEEGINFHCYLKTEDNEVDTHFMGKSANKIARMAEGETE